MPRTRSNRQQNRQLDAVIALPLARFRSSIAALSPGELTALAERINLKMVEQRWALGGHGIARHRAPRELELLARRLVEIQRVVATGSPPASVQLRLLELTPGPVEGTVLEFDEAA